MFEIYEDSASPQWLQLLESMMIECYISPCHDKDVKEDGTPKKPHYHVVVKFDGGKSEAFCQAIIDDVGGANGYGVVPRSLGGSIRYLSHTGYPSKYQYNPDDIIVLGGGNLKKYFSDTDVSDVSTVTQVIRYIRDNSVLYFCDIVDLGLAQNPSWIRALRSTWFSSLVREYIRSQKEKCSDGFSIDPTLQF